MSDHLEEIATERHRAVLRPPDVPPNHSASYRVGPEQPEPQQKVVAQMEKSTVAEPAVTECSTPIVFEPKMERRLYFYVYYCRLNAIAVHDNYPMPRMDECIEFFRKTKIFLELDANSEYFGFEMDEKDVDKAPFITLHKLYKYAKLPTKLKNNPVKF